MKKNCLIFCLGLVLLLSSCASMTGGIKNLPEPEDENVVVMGAILMENVDMPFVFEYWELPLQVVLLGKTEEGEINHYTVSADKDGYYCLPNVPKGAYLLKAVIFQEPGTIPNIINNDWEYLD